MKRKLRLVSSIFSLALAFTFMAIGVFAAAQKTVAVSGRVGFQAERLDATVVVKSTAGAIATAPGTTEANYATNPATGMTTGTVTFSSTTDVGNQTAGFGDITMSESKIYYGIMIKITVPAGAVGVKVTAPDMTNPSGTHFTLNKTITGDITTSGSTLAAGETASIFYVFQLKDAKGLADLDFTPFDVTITLERAA